VVTSLYKPGEGHATSSHELAEKYTFVPSHLGLDDRLAYEGSAIIANNRSYSVGECVAL